MAETTSTPLRYMPQLDSLRALAAIGVFAQHFLAESNFFVSTVPLGDLGVRMFFVLSGFLITAILLDSRQSIERGSISRPSVMRHFYARRFLRLIPVYFIFLTFTFLFIPEVQKYAWWFYSYLQNIHYAIEGQFTVADHIWTLAVEEQFYLLWPLLILFLPRRLLLPTMIGVVVLGVTSRIAFIGMGMTHFQASMLTPSHFDTLGIGALLAILVGTWHRQPNVRKKYLYVAFVLGIVLLGIVFLAKIKGMTSIIEFILGELGAGLLFVCVIGFAANGIGGPIGFVLNQPALVYLGKISYGMYVYHWFVPYLAEHALSTTGFSLPDLEWIRWFVFSTVAIVMAMISWHLIERPILRLKKFFSYHQTTRDHQSDLGSSDLQHQPEDVKVGRVVP